QGRPILEHILEGLKSAGIDKVCIITGWRADAIEGHFRDGSNLGLEITYARQVVQDGTGRAPEYARAFVGSDDFLLTYGDILVPPVTYSRMVDRYAGGEYAGLITVTVGEDISKGGLNLFDADFCLTHVVEKPSAV